MSMAQVIRAAMKKQGVTVSQLSRQLGCTTQNISGKMRRDNFRESRLNNIPVSWVGKLLQQLTHSAFLRLF